ncbi:MAG TPA: DUF5060 domain-containing protein [archaeon]|nr:DUF5060 domain-containing protein [archaeon]
MIGKVKIQAVSILAAGFLVLAAAVRAGAPAINFLRPNKAELGLYEKFELRIGLEATFTNPFDPDQIDIQAEFTAPSGKKWTIRGFYNPSGWNSLWMVRFSPNEKGLWHYQLKVTDSGGTAGSEPGSFTAVDSQHHGWLNIAPNRRYLKYDDGTSFYGVGMWYNDSYEGFNRGQITEEELDNLKRRGANFISFFPTPLETLGTGLGRYDQNRCGRLDQLFEWCETRDIHISWNIWFHSYISQAIWGGGNARYRFTPYKQVCEAVDFFQDPTAWEYQKKLYRYMIARWGYSRSLFLWFIVDEIDGTEGWEQGDKALADQWSAKVHNYFKEHDPYLRPTTGTQCGAFPRYWATGYGIFDIAAREIYEAQRWPMPKEGKITGKSGNPLQFSYRNYASEIRKLWDNFQKPSIIGETGWDHTYYEPGMPGYLAIYHNVLWASLCSGLSMTPFWWAYSDYINDNVVTNQMKFFADFTADIDFANLDLSHAEIKATDGCDAYAMKSDRIVFGWVVNPRESVANVKFTVSGLPDGDYEVELYRTWRGEYLEKHTVACSGGKLTDTVPELLTKGGHANHIGNDVAFKIRPK